MEVTTLENFECMVNHFTGRSEQPFAFLQARVW